MEQESGLRALNMNQLHFDLLILNPIYKLLQSNIDYDLFFKNTRQKNPLKIFPYLTSVLHALFYHSQLIHRAKLP